MNEMSSTHITINMPKVNISSSQSAKPYKGLCVDKITQRRQLQDLPQLRYAVKIITAFLFVTYPKDEKDASKNKPEYRGRNQS